LKLFRTIVASAIVLVAASLVMFLVSFWTGDYLAPAINTIQFILVLASLIMSVFLFFKVEKEALSRDIWGIVSISLAIDLVGVSCELVNGYARSWKVSQDVVFIIYLFVWLALLVVPFVLYVKYRHAGFGFSAEAYYAVIPSLVIVSLATVVLVLVPLARSDLDVGTKISNFVAPIVGLGMLFFLMFLVATLGKGELGKPWLFLSLCVASIVIQTIVSTNVMLVLGYMRVLEPANFFLHLGYGFLLIAEAYQYRITTGA
jgi:hypothetical protein